MERGVSYLLGDWLLTYAESQKAGTAAQACQRRSYNKLVTEDPLLLVPA